MAENRFKPPRALLGALEAAANRVLTMDPDIGPRLHKLSGKVLRVNILGLGAHFYALVCDRSVIFLEDFGGSADVSLSATPFTLARMALSGEGRVIGNSDIQLEGDMQTAQHFQYLLASLEIDWEELLAQRIGDVAARQVGLLAEGLSRWLKRGQTSVDMAVRDYLQEEVQHTPTRIELDNFAGDVDAVRMDVDRLEARIKRLATKQ